MLKRIKIENLRGIREGEIDGLTRLVVLVGPNGSGKSTVLEGAFIGGSSTPANAVGLATQRRTHTRKGARWLIRGGDEKTTAAIVAEFADGQELIRKLEWRPSLHDARAIEYFAERRSPGPFSAVRIHQQGITVTSSKVALVGVAADNDFRAFEIDLRAETSVQLVEPRGGEPLHDLFSRVVQVGRRDDAVERLGYVVPSLQGVEILTEDSEPRLFMTFRHGAVPASLAGDGVHALLRMIFELATPAGGTVLLEEPEVHMHPRALLACVRAIVGAVRREVQVILTTHSLELVDSLLAELTEDERADSGVMTLCRVQLREGKLVHTLIGASEAVQARMALAEDLR